MDILSAFTFIVLIWVALLLTAIPVVTGILLGRFASGARLICRAAPAVLLLSLVPCVIRRNEFLFPFQALGLETARSGICFLIFAAILSVCAVVCAFVPRRPSFLFAVAMSWIWMLYASVILGAAVIGVLSFPIGGIVSYILSAAALTFSCMGASLKKTKPISTKQTEHLSQRDAVPSGRLVILVQPYLGKSISIPSGKTVKIGASQEFCQCCLPVAQMPPCLCSVIWNALKGTYRVTILDTGGILLEDGSRIPNKSVLEFFPGQVFYLPVNGQPVFQIG